MQVHQALEGLPMNHCFSSDWCHQEQTLCVALHTAEAFVPMPSQTLPTDSLDFSFPASSSLPLFPLPHLGPSKHNMPLLTHPACLTCSPSPRAKWSSGVRWQVGSTKEHKQMIKSDISTGCFTVQAN